jgi:NADH:ubiquinone oxidoreductase subunit 6 (subunit J)
MHSLISLLGVFFTTVLFYLLGGIIFVGFTFLIVYVGAVAILFLFVIMLLNAKSLTSREALIRHSSQYAALAVASTLLQEIYLNTLSALERVLHVGDWRVATYEASTGDSVLYYVQYSASDINALTALYTVHTPLFLVTVAILLVSLVGALILATMTTERPISVSDLLKYTTRLLNTTPRIVVAAGAPAILGASAVVCAASFFIAPEILGTVLPLFMSFYEPRDHKNKNIIDGLMGGCDSYQTKRVVWPKQFTAPQIALWRVSRRGKRQALASLDEKQPPDYYAPEDVTKNPHGVLAKVSIGPIRKLTSKYWNYIDWKTKPARGMRNAALRGKLFRKLGVNSLKTKRMSVLSVKTRVGLFFLLKKLRERLRKRARRRVRRALVLRAFLKLRRLRRRGRSFLKLRRHKRKALRGYYRVRVTGAKVRAVYAALYKLRSEISRRGRKRSIRRHNWLWHWRPDRATSLTRIIRTNIPWRVKGVRRREWHQRPWRAELYDRTSPFNFKTLGLWKYLNYMYRMEVVPEILVWAWRVRAFCAAFCYYLVVIPLVLVPIPWFLNDMDIAWHDLTDIWACTKSNLARPFPSLLTLPAWAFNALVALMFYPTAAWMLLFHHPWSVMFVAAIYAYDVVLYAGGMLPKSEGHESECNYFRLSYADIIAAYDHDIWVSGHAARVRHPDKGRIDFSFFFLICPVGVPYAKSALYLASYLAPIWAPIAHIFATLQVCTSTAFTQAVYVFLALQSGSRAALLGLWDDIGPTVTQLWEKCVSFAYWATNDGVYYYRRIGPHKFGDVGADPVALVLLLIGLGFVLSSLFIARYWVPVQTKEVPKLSVLFPLVVFVVWLYCLIVYLRCAITFNILFGLPVGTFQEAYAGKRAFWFVVMYMYIFLFLVGPYFAYRRLFTGYWWMPRYRFSVLRRCINDYLHNINFMLIRGSRKLEFEHQELSRAQVVEHIAHIHAKRKAHARKMHLKHHRRKEFWPTQIFISHDPHPQKDYFDKYWPLQVAMPYRPKAGKKYTMW